MKPGYRRADRVSSEIHEIIALLLSRFAPEPSLDRLTITSVKVSDDLKFARVFYSVFPGESPELYQRTLLRCRGLIRKELGRLIRLKTIPTLEFLRADYEGYGPALEEIPEARKEDDSQKKIRERSSLMDELEGK
ncbi:MAG: 30S ribosome-binding factor RbfA [Leptospirales bacterium]